MAEFDPYKAGEESRKKRMADMIAPNAYTAKTKSEQSSIDRRAKMFFQCQVVHPPQANAHFKLFRAKCKFHGQ